MSLRGRNKNGSDAFRVQAVVLNMKNQPKLAPETPNLIIYRAGIRLLDDSRQPRPPVSWHIQGLVPLQVTQNTVHPRVQPKILI